MFFDQNSHCYLNGKIIKMKDEQLMNEGFNFLNQRLPNVSYLVQGFNETYGK
mgnify:CR=1 FL=1